MTAMGKLSWRTHVLLEQLAHAIESDLPFWAAKAREVGREHAEMFASCDEDTCPTVPRGRTQELVLLKYRRTTGIPTDDDQ